MIHSQNDAMYRFISLRRQNLQNLSLNQIQLSLINCSFIFCIQIYYLWPYNCSRGDLNACHGLYYALLSRTTKCVCILLVVCSLVGPLFGFKLDQTHFTGTRNTSVNKNHGLFLILVNEMATAWPRMTLPPSRSGAKLGKNSAVGA